MASIDCNKVRSAVYGRIDFKLPENIWQEINDAFGYYWNEIVGFGHDITEEGIVDYIAASLKDRHILFPRSRIVHIIHIILDYIEMTGGFLDETKPFIPKFKE